MTVGMAGVAGTILAAYASMGIRMIIRWLRHSCRPLADMMRNQMPDVAASRIGEATRIGQSASMMSLSWHLTMTGKPAKHHGRSTRRATG